MTREFLKEHIKKLDEAKGLKYEIEQMYQTMKSPIITDMPTAHSPDADKIGIVISQIQEKEIRYLAKLNVILTEEKEIDEFIDSLEDSRQRIVMRYIYIS